MKRVVAVLFIVALMSGCAYTDDCKRCTELCQAAVDKAAAVEQTCTSSLKASEAAAMKAENAARRAEKAADRAEAILNQHVKGKPHKAIKARRS